MLNYVKINVLVLFILVYFNLFQCILIYLDRLLFRLKTITLTVQLNNTSQMSLYV